MLEIKNYMEDLVFQEMDEVIKDLQCCGCENAVWILLQLLLILCSPIM